MSPAFLTFNILFVVLMFGVFTVHIFLSLRREVKEGEQLVRGGLDILERERDEKREILEELADLSLRFTTQDELKLVSQDRARIADELGAERGRLTVAQAEMEAVDVRLRELEEIERELENCNIEVARELEILRRQEKETSDTNRLLAAQLDSTVLQLDRLLHELAGSREVVQKLTAAKNELLASQQKIQFYTQEITALNKRFIDLKRAYDALDIEYAQLYEKHSQG